MNPKSRLVLLTAALLSTSMMACADDASTADATHIRSETLKYSASQVATPEGAVNLYTQLKLTAARVCQQSAAMEGHGTTSVKTCIHDAVDAAVRQLDLPLVSAIHLHAGKPASVAAVR